MRTPTAPKVRRASVFLRAMAWLLALVGCARFLQVSYSALSAVKGDFYVSLPGPYAERINPVLWESPDLRESWAYQSHTYRYGPTQFLTLYPIVFLDSFRQISLVLLGVYAGLVLVSLWLFWRGFAPDDAQSRSYGLPLLIACVLLFFPLLQVYVQREFEMVVCFGLVLATCLLAKGHDLRASAIIAYVSWFKFWPVVFVGYFALRRRWMALMVFAATSALVLLATHLVFDLGFFMNGLLTELPRRYTSQALTVPGSFCADWSGVGGTGSQETLASLRWGLCTMSRRATWLAPRAVFYTLVCAIAAAFLFGFVRLERSGAVGAAARRWRTLLEVSVVLLSATVSVHGHYYYLIFSLIPIAGLLLRYVERREWGKLALLAVVYVFLTAFVLPASLLSRVLRRDAWRLYMENALYLFGLLPLFGLLLWEYLSLAAHPADEQAVQVVEKSDPAFEDKAGFANQALDLRSP